METFGSEPWKANQPIRLRGLKVLRARLGTAEYRQHLFDDVLQEETQLQQMILKLPSLLSSWLLLHSCAVPRVKHLLRTLPPDEARPLAVEHDRCMLHTFWQLFGFSPAEHWNV